MTILEIRLDLFFGTLATLLAVINPLEALPIFLGLVGDKDKAVQLAVARRSCIYAALLMVFFLVFGTLVLRAFGVPLSMVRVAGGIVLVRIGFSLFLPSNNGSSPIQASSNGNPLELAFVPLAMPIMFGPGVLATIVGMSASVKPAHHPVLAAAAIVLAIVITMAITYLVLAYSRNILKYIGPKGIDAATRLVGFFVAAMGMGMVFHGVVNELTVEMGFRPKQ